MKYRELSEESRKNARNNFQESEYQRTGCSETEFVEFIARIDLDRIFILEFNEDGSIQKGEKI